MANTLIQIKRSTVTNTPPNGSLESGELAYSYSSNIAFIGTSDGAGVLQIGGKYWTDVAVAAFDAANNAQSAGMDYPYVNTATQAANTYANSVGVAVGIGANNYANGLATSVGAGANVYADSVGVGANNYADATFLPLTGGTISNNLVISGNLTVSGETTYANTQTLLIGDNIFVLNADLPGASAPSENAGMEINRGSSTDVSLIWNEGTDKWTFTNDGSVYLNIASNTDVETAGAGANTYADSVGVGANTYAASVGVGANTYADSVGVGANTYAASVGVGANTYADSVGVAANTNASNASYLSTGTVPTGRISGSYTGISGVGTLTSGTWNADIITVPYGGTGLSTAANNGVIFGNTAGPFRVTSAGTEGQVLQANADGTPLFGDLDGGVF